MGQSQGYTWVERRRKTEREPRSVGVALKDLNCCKGFTKKCQYK